MPTPPLDFGIFFIHDEWDDPEVLYRRIAPSISEDNLSTSIGQYDQHLLRIKIFRLLEIGFLVHLLNLSLWIKKYKWDFVPISVLFDSFLRADADENRACNHAGHYAFCFARQHAHYFLPSGNPEWKLDIFPLVDILFRDRQFPCIAELYNIPFSDKKHLTNYYIKNLPKGAMTYMGRNSEIWLMDFISDNVSAIHMSGFRDIFFNNLKSRSNDQWDKDVIYNDKLFDDKQINDRLKKSLSLKRFREYHFLLYHSIDKNILYNEFQKAELGLDKCISICQDDPRPRFARAALLFIRGAYRLAREDFNKAKFVEIGIGGDLY